MRNRRKRPTLSDFRNRLEGWIESALNNDWVIAVLIGIDAGLLYLWIIWWQ